MKHLENYYEGKGCKCFARSSSECGCPDVDWTPKAVYELRADGESQWLAWLGYCGENNTSEVFQCVHATTRQRAKAFLQTIGKWNESAKMKNSTQNE